MKTTGKNLPFRAIMAVAIAMLALAAMPLQAQYFQNLYDFGSSSTLGLGPLDDRLTQGRDGNLYGTTNYGGTYTAGTIFMVTPSGAYTDLFEFDNKSGISPHAGLTLASDGNFYGITFQGGTYGYGTLFRFTPPGTLKVLHDFKDSDGANPWGAPTQAADGNLYGLTDLGKTYRLTLPGGKFSNLADNIPGVSVNRLLLASDKNLYGTTANGGEFGFGTVFQMTTAGVVTPIYSFTGGTDGSTPIGSLMQGWDGNLYGTTTAAGPNGFGDVFKMSLSGNITVLHGFDPIVNGVNNDGANPVSALTAATDGHLYGVNFSAGANGGGTIFDMDYSGTPFNKLFDFTGSGGAVPGSAPDTGLLQHTNGILYALTADGGSYFTGNFYSVTPPNPLLSLIVEGPIFVMPGIAVEILGSELEQTYSVEFNSVPAQFELGSETYLTAQVPMNAVDGYVTVTLQSGYQIQSQMAVQILPVITNLDPPSGPVGTQVAIVGGGFTGASAVSFDGVQTPNFAAISPTLIEAIVPSGAKTGKVIVTTPNGTATSPNKFTVTK